MMSRINAVFNPENRFWMFMDKVTDAVLISLLWLVCSLPVVTMGAATAAVFQFTLHQVRDEEGYVWKSFFKAFRQNFRQATALWLGGLAAGAFLAADLYVCMRIPVPGAVRVGLTAVLGCLGLIYLLTMIYVLPLTACFRVTARAAIRDSFVMAVGNLPVSLLILVVYGIFFVIACYRPGAAVFCVGLAIFVSSYLFHFVFRRYGDQEIKTNVNNIKM